ncbi:ABC transporter ATP-binding protein [Candidatus Odyssella acanthamoebae]|uniref:ABC transporter ATP-binding protein n=1 Tax=Candidatus Odyssella acanthamoebae TaxID=91604 RepID=A0A077B259_9PROT|nr:ABC transporter ATP-binding protein [Candidatus Paracaedibacter acanthamoebae]AIK97045.1 ABC transporter ATP-binding protein [Candidatus Paracaedibacter acanthamoebae]
MITLNNIHLTFAPNTVREKKALVDLSLQINEGDFITVIGSNGAGKSTLLNTISGEYIPDAGSILIDDENVTTLPAQRRAHMVARVFQDPLAGTCGELTIAENLALADRRGFRRGIGRALNSKNKGSYKDILGHLNLGLEYRLDTAMSLLSGGQRQAISLLMATMSPLKILLLDEHTSALDPKTAAFVMDLTQQVITEKNLTALMVTHSLHQALHYGNRTIMLHEGKVIYDVSGKEREKMTIDDVMGLFSNKLDDDRLILT